MYLLSKTPIGITLVVLTLSLISCEKENLFHSSSDRDFIQTRSHDCESICIDSENPVYAIHTGYVQQESGPNTRRFDYEVYNTLNGFMLNWTYTTAGPSSPTRSFRLVVSDAGFSVPLTYNTGCVNNGATGSHFFPFDVVWEACEIVMLEASIRDCAGTLVGTANNDVYHLVGECHACDEASFGYSTDDQLAIVFTLNTSEALTDAQVEFTFPQVLNLQLDANGSYTGPDGKMYTVNNPTNQTVFTWTGDVSCLTAEAETFAFSFQPDCGAGNAHDGQAVIWTDTKVNGISVKGDLQNIVYTGCPL